MLTNDSDKFRPAFAADYHSLLGSSQIMDNCGLRVEQLHVLDHYVPNISFSVSRY